MHNALRLVALAVLVPSFAGAGQVFKVGPGGTHATVQEAVAAAIAAGGDNEVRVASGTLVGLVDVGGGLSSGSIEISGGWDATFALQTLDPELTVLDGAEAGSVFYIHSSGGSVALRNLSVTRGRSEVGGGIRVEVFPSAGATVTISNCILVGNTAVLDTFGGSGGGLDARLGGTSTLTASRLQVVRNTSSSAGYYSVAGGAFLSTSGSAQIVLEGSVLAGNTCTSGTAQVAGAGLYCMATDSSKITVKGSSVARNVTNAVGANPSSGAKLCASGSARIAILGSAFVGNTRSGANPYAQVALESAGSAGIDFANSIVAGGGGRGVVTFVYGSSTSSISSSTIAGNAEDALMGSPSSVFDTIIYGNGTDSQINQGVAAGGNLIGVDPLFVNAALGDYRLLPGSPAIDAGFAPPGGLSVADSAGRTRVVGSKVDIGAHEYQGATRLAAAALAHTTGFGNTPWHSDLDLANPGGKPAELILRFRSANGEMTRPVTLASGETRGWSDVLVGLFGIGATAKISGALKVEDPTGAVVAAVRTYADGGSVGIFGQSYPALPEGAGLSSGTVGILPMVKSNTKLYSNVGILNLGATRVEARVTLVGPLGGTLGSPVTIAADPGVWEQASDVFTRAGAAKADVAYATIETLTAGGRLWGAASVVDQITRDPTTVEASVAEAPGTVQRVASVTHSSGYAGTAWRSTVAVVNAGASDARVTLTFRGASTLVKTASVVAHGVLEWEDVLVDLLGLDAGASASGSLEVVADRPVVVGCRTYADKGKNGTFGQSYPALTADRGLTAGGAGVLPQVRRVRRRTPTSVRSICPWCRATRRFNSTTPRARLSGRRYRSRRGLPAGHRSRTSSRQPARVGPTSRTHGSTSPPRGAACGSTPRSSTL